MSRSTLKVLLALLLLAVGDASLDHHQQTRRSSEAPFTIGHCRGSCCLETSLPYCSSAMELGPPELYGINISTSSSVLTAEFKLFQVNDGTACYRGNLPRCPCNHCGTSDGWTRVVYLNMQNTSTSCPGDLREYPSSIYPKRGCGRHSVRKCESAFFPVNGMDYSMVCGRVVAYQYGHATAFESYSQLSLTSIDTPYMDGVVLTHGRSARNHVWSFVTANSERSSAPASRVCPCTNPDDSSPSQVPPFVGGDYFCDTGVSGHTPNEESQRNGWRPGFYGSDPLWDGEGCEGSECCSFNNPPYFEKVLGHTTSDDLELRVCSIMSPYDRGGGDTVIEELELYVKQPSAQDMEERPCVCITPPGGTAQCTPAGCGGEPTTATTTTPATTNMPASTDGQSLPAKESEFHRWSNKDSDELLLEVERVLAKLDANKNMKRERDTPTHQ